MNLTLCVMEAEKRVADESLRSVTGANSPAGETGKAPCRPDVPCIPLKTVTKCLRVLNITKDLLISGDWVKTKIFDFHILAEEYLPSSNAPCEVFTVIFRGRNPYTTLVNFLTFLKKFFDNLFINIIFFFTPASAMHCLLGTVLSW